MDETGSQHELWRSRRDLQVLSDDQGNRERWCVFDPLSRQSYRMGAVEHWFLLRARSPCRLGALIAEFKTSHPTYGGDTQSLLNLLQRLQQSGLIVRQGGIATAKPHSKSPASILGLLSKLVALQVRGLNPESWLNYWAPRTDLFLSRRSVVFWLFLAVVTFCAVLFDFDRLLQEMGSFNWMLSPSAGGALFIVFIVTRAIHELGHGLVCTRFGIRVPDLGVFFVLGAPCVYCDVSESWRLMDRRQRAAVAAAGMYAELLIATAAAWIWLVTVEGPTHTLAMQTMLVCSVGTILININPLMKFDGYYMLSDWLDETNLRGRADAATLQAIRDRFSRGSRTPSSLTWQRRHFLIAFSCASAIYRVVLSITVAGVLMALFSKWQLVWIGRILAVAILCSWWGNLIVKLTALFAHQFQRPVRATALSIAMCAALVAIASIPIPNRQFAKGWVEPQKTLGIYAPATGRLAEACIRSGEIVTTGQPLLRLESNEIELRLVAVKREAARREVQLVHTTFASESNREATREAIDPQVARQNQLLVADAAAQRERLLVAAPIAGRLIAFPASRPTGPVAQTRHLQSVALSQHTDWCDPSQLGRTVRQGTLLAAICGDENQAVVILDKTQIADVAVGTGVRLHLTQQPEQVIVGTVSAVVELSHRDSVWRPKDSSDGQVSPSAEIAALVALPQTATSFPGGHVEAVFVGPATSLATHLRRWLQTNIKQLAD